MRLAGFVQGTGQAALRSSCRPVQCLPAASSFKENRPEFGCIGGVDGRHRLILRPDKTRRFINCRQKTVKFGRYRHKKPLNRKRKTPGGPGGLTTK